MEFEIMSIISEPILKLVRSLLKYFDFLLHIPYVKFVAFGFGALVVFIKEHLIPKRLKLRKSFRNR